MQKRNTVSIHSFHSFHCFILTHKSRLCNLHPPVPSSKSWNLATRLGHAYQLIPTDSPNVATCLISIAYWKFET